MAKRITKNELNDMLFEAREGRDKADIAFDSIDRKYNEALETIDKLVQDKNTLANKLEKIWQALDTRIATNYPLNHRVNHQHEGRMSNRIDNYEAFSQEKHDSKVKSRSEEENFLLYLQYLYQAG